MAEGTTRRNLLWVWMGLAALLVAVAIGLLSRVANTASQQPRGPNLTGPNARLEPPNPTRAPTTDRSQPALSPGTGATGAPAGEAARERIVDVGMGEWHVHLQPDTVPAGRLVFRVRNSGKYRHGLAVEGHGISLKGKVLQPADHDDLSAELKTGDYTLYCFVGNHRGKGMVATLHVQ